MGWLAAIGSAAALYAAAVAYMYFGQRGFAIRPDVMLGLDQRIVFRPFKVGDAGKPKVFGVGV